MARVENKYQSDEKLKSLMKSTMARVLKRNGFDLADVQTKHLYNELAMSALETLDELAQLQHRKGN